MSNYYEFIALFKTELIENLPLKIIYSPTIKFEYFKENRTYKINKQINYIVIKGKETTIARDEDLILNDKESYLLLTTRTQEKNPSLARKECEKNIDNFITMFSLIYNSHVFYNLVCRGWKIEIDRGRMRAWIQPSESFGIDSNILIGELEKIKKNICIDSDMKVRFELLSRFFSKALTFNPSEEKYILLWTILEIYPMKGTTNIKPISNELAKIIGKTPDTIKQKLDIGRLYGYRCNLVHDGIFSIDLKDMGNVFSKLEKIILVILRSIAGLPYNGILEQYFNN